jgi:TPR repeat protein
MKIQRMLLVFALFITSAAMAQGLTAPDTLIGVREIPLHRLYQAATEEDDPDSMYLLGLMFDRGAVLSQNYQEALRWYGLASALGQRDAMNSVGVMYALGHGVPQDASEALNWWTKAAGAGSVAALTNIATTYYNGLGANGVIQMLPSGFGWQRIKARGCDEHP